MILKLIITILYISSTLNLYAAQISDQRDPEVFSLKKQNKIILTNIKHEDLKKESLPVIADNWMVVTANIQASRAAAKIDRKSVV